MTRVVSLLAFSVIASAQQYVMSTVAGGLPPVTPADAATVSIGDPPRVAIDSAGNVYFGSLHSIYKVDRNGSLTRIAGTGRAGLSADGPALSAQLMYPVGIAVDAAGAIYYTEKDSTQLRRLAAGAITTLPVEGLVRPMGLRFDAAGNLYIADNGANVIRKLAPGGVLTTVAGNGSQGFGGDGGLATSASLNGPEGVALDAAGNLYIADTFNHRVRVVTKDGAISTFAGTGLPGFSGDDGKAVAATMFLPTDVGVDSNGSVYIADLGNSRIRKVINGTITTIAGNSGGLPPREGLGATAVRLAGPTGIAVDPAGVVYIAEGSIGSGSGLGGGVFRVWKVENGTLHVTAGTGYNSFSGDSGPAALAQFDTPAGIAFDKKGNLYIADSANHRVRKIGTDGTVTTVAGNALPGFSGDGGLATSAELNRPTGVAVDSLGNLFIADSGNNRIREVLTNGVIGTLAGNGNTAFFGDGGSSLKAALNHPQGVAIGFEDSIWIADTGNHCVRRVISGQIETIVQGLNMPIGIVPEDSGNVWVADAGDGSVRYSFKGGTLTASLPGARGVTKDPSGNVFATGTDRVVKINNDGSTVIVAGTGQCCYSGDGGPAAAARVNEPWGIASDASGNLYIADSGNNSIRVASVSASTFFIRSVVNAASNQAGPIVAGEVITIYGVGLGPATLVTGSGTDIQGVRVTVGGTPAQLLYASAGQIAAVVPPSIIGPSADVVVVNGNASTAAYPAQVVLSNPAIFTADSTGGGAARAINGDGSVNGPTHPALDGTALTFFITGEGQVPGSTVTIGGRNAEVQTAGGAGVPGVTQMTVTVPTGVSGNLPILLTIGGVSSQTGVTVSVQ
jgi:uncharacterized protein (TIGR03437 family)